MVTTVAAKYDAGSSMWSPYPVRVVAGCIIIYRRPQQQAGGGRSTPVRLPTVAALPVRGCNSCQPRLQPCSHHCTLAQLSVGGVNGCGTERGERRGRVDVNLDSEGVVWQPFAGRRKTGLRDAAGGDKDAASGAWATSTYFPTRSDEATCRIFGSLADRNH
uniref:Uncharacterized protein n=1 Tax=Aegilops tauschii subsp. strangulata TaxID=200361 RepID=A0A453HVL7_AEGTS